MRTLAELQNVRVGDMTPDERKLVTRAALAKLQTEFKQKAPQIEAALAKFDDDRAGE